MLTQRQALEEARGNIAAGTTIAARLKESSQNPEIRELSGFRIALRRRSWEAWNKPSRRSSSAGISLSCNSLIMDLSHLHVPKPDRFESTQLITLCMVSNCLLYEKYTIGYS